MTIIKKKTWPEYFEAVASGKKNYDLRINDDTRRRHTSLGRVGSKNKALHRKKDRKEGHFCREV